MRRSATILLLIAGVLCATTPASARPYWKTRIDNIAAGKQIGIVVHDDGRTLYTHAARVKRAPASNEKLLMSMALFEHLDPSTTIDTRAFVATPPIARVVAGDLWITGRGDPTITAGAGYGRSLPFPATNLGALARSIAALADRVDGRVMANTGYFEHDWFAPGWKEDFPDDEIALPSALTFEGNTRNGNHISDPEARAARALTRKLESFGVEVAGHPGAGQMPGDGTLIAAIESRPLATLVRYMNRNSSNFFAEVLGKRLGVAAADAPGTIAKGASAIEAFAARAGVQLTAHDSSGLSYRNRVAPVGIVKLLTHVEEATDYYEVLRRGLPTGGQGTLEDRLGDVRIRAKTGSLDGVSALSGWIWLPRTRSWAEFSILSSGMYYSTAKGVEDRIVRVLAKLAR
jgi:D-alanyl-D-alanine carboxypeptidase/D-alanyl-D-alanine-endopeptidase (penicillin-binding protein 4)